MKLIKVRASGGFKIHLISRGNREALCGLVPKLRTGRRASNTRWYSVYEGDSQFRECVQCFDKYRNDPHAKIEPQT